jgi:hypothetical protein
MLGGMWYEEELDSNGQQLESRILDLIGVSVGIYFKRWIYYLKMG